MSNAKSHTISAATIKTTRAMDVLAGITGFALVASLILRMSVIAGIASIPGFGSWDVVVVVAAAYLAVATFVAPSTIFFASQEGEDLA